ncbi:MAG: class I poly(R)-hydroxyalkanoic acid synthase [Yoonia sp.]
MTTNDCGKLDPPAEPTGKLDANLKRIEALSQRLIAVMGQGRGVPAALQGPSPDLYAKAAGAYVADMVNDPSKLFESQIAFWGKTVQHYVDAQQSMADQSALVPADPTSADKRFANEMWNTNPYFRYVKQQYLANAQLIQDAVADISGLDGADRRRLEYFSQQIIDMMAPTNFLATNPDALALAAETEGESLVAGLENLVSDLEANNGDLVVTLADQNAFQVGENLATTAGQVVFRNHLFELIQYAPSTQSVHETPLVIFPPWINRFYVLDLTPQKSLIKWAVDQGHTVCVVSWVNPDETYRNTTLTDYIEDGYLTAISKVKEICGVSQVNAVGYCIAGTTLSLTLALMAQRGDTSVKSATLFTTLTDFSDRGEVGVFLDEDFVSGIEAEVAQSGVLSSFYMSRTFSFLRSNDLIYGPAIKSYMMGKAPPAFDLLYWNGDGTNLPAAMAVEYLRGLCQGDLFAKDGLEICGTTVHLSDVAVPICAIACETDHIAAWKSSYRGVQQMGSTEKTFILSQAGHIAGIVNPPSKNKYGHYTQPDLSLSPDAWRASAEMHDGSWWPRWDAWLTQGRDPKTAPRNPVTKHGAAPGSYVLG